MSKHKWSNFYHHMTTINPESIWTLINLPKHSSHSQLYSQKINMNILITMHLLRIENQPF